MEKQATLPNALRHKVFLTLITGAASFLIAITVFAGSGDRILLCLGTILFFLCIGKGYLLWRTLSMGDYETVIGVCIEITQPPLCRCRKITIISEHDTQLTLLLGKQTRIFIGSPYRFYFRKDTGFNWGSDYLNSALATDLFLGYEQLPANTLAAPAADEFDI